jgi:hypothetical protein
VVSHVLDANVFITAHRDYYPPDRVPQFWDWLTAKATAGAIKVPLPIWDEIERVYNPLKDWQQAHRSVFIIEEAAADARVGTILDLYATDLTEDEMLRIGADPFLAAYGQEFGAKVVTKEVSKPTCQRANKRLPDICAQCRIPWITDHVLIRELDFRA